MANIRPLSNALAKRAAVELNEVHSDILDHIHKVREWLKTQLHLRTPLNDQFLVTFLRYNKYNIEETKRRIALYFSLRDELPQIWKDRDPIKRKSAELLKMGVMVNLPYPIGEDGPAVTLIKSGHCDSSKYTVMDFFRVTGAISDCLCYENDNLVIAGYIAIYDLGGQSNNIWLNFDEISKVIDSLTRFTMSAYPAMLRSFHYINIPNDFLSLFNIIISLTTQEVRNIIYVHENIETLYDFVPKRYLPIEYGGESGSFQHMAKYWNSKILMARDWLLEWEHYGINKQFCKKT